MRASENWQDTANDSFMVPTFGRTTLSNYHEPDLLFDGLVLHRNDRRDEHIILRLNIRMRDRRNTRITKENIQKEESG